MRGLIYNYTHLHPTKYSALRDMSVSDDPFFVVRNPHASPYRPENPDLRPPEIPQDLMIPPAQEGNYGPGCCI